MKAKDLFPGIFSRHAGAYRRRLESSMAEGQAASRRAVLEFAAARPGERVLDIACGPGTLTLPLVEAVLPGGDVVGIDLAPGMLEQGREAAHARGLSVRFELMDAEALEFPDAAFDAVTCGHGLQFCPDLARVLAEARRVLKPGGRLAASVPADGNTAAASILMKQAEAQLLPPAPEAADRAATQAIVSDLERFRQAALAAGFSEARTEFAIELRTWPDARTLVDNISGWWATASRLEQLDEAGRERFRAAALAALEKQFGDGPIEVEGGTNLLFARA